jgi:hypothetical protein
MVQIVCVISVLYRNYDGIEFVDGIDEGLALPSQAAESQNWIEREEVIR